MRRGAVYWINLEPSHPPELGKVRPAIVVSNSDYNERLASVVVVPLSTKAPEIWPLRLAVELPGGAPSFIVVPGIRQISRARLHELIGQLPATAMARLSDALALYLGE